MKGKTVLITGASNGIGRAIALEFAEPNNTILLTWNSDKEGIEETQELALKKGAGVQIYNLRLERINEIQDFCKKINSFCSPDILINNAAFAQKKDFMSINDDDLEKVLSVNLKAPFRLCQNFIPNMKMKGWGRIINISSIGGQWGGIHQVHYALSKAALINLTRSLAKLYSKDGIISSSITPGIIDTAMTSETLGHNIDQELLSQIPIGRLGTSEEVAKAAKYLSSDEAAYLSGITLNVNGGMYFNS